MTERWVITGRVQGVGYRDWLAEAARALAVGGSCRNERDGTVVAIVDGDRESLDLLAARCRVGPPASHVTGVARATASEAVTVPRPFRRS